MMDKIIQFPSASERVKRRAKKYKFNRKIELIFDKTFLDEIKSMPSKFSKKTIDKHFWDLT